ncbi:MAG: imidazole glycerol phosphate synthase subunit HisH [Negativicutes bacterium]
MIAIVDYGVGNIRAFANIYSSLGISFKIASKLSDFDSVTKIILPGVGAFDYAMSRLHLSGLRDKLNELVLERKMPVLGVCVGMQMLARSSEEGTLSGLGWIDGEVKKFDSSLLNQGLNIPHMGWNNIVLSKYNKITKDLETAPRFYFLHSYYFCCSCADDVVAITEYGDKFASVVNSDNVYGIQCHPEKSHNNGITLLKNFWEL